MQVAWELSCAMHISRSGGTRGSLARTIFYLMYKTVSLLSVVPDCFTLREARSEREREPVVGT